MADSGVKLSIRVFGIRVGSRRSLGLFKSVGAFVFLAHSIDDEHDYEDST